MVDVSGDRKDTSEDSEDDDDDEEEEDSESEKTWGAIQYSLEKYLEEYHKLVMIFVMTFKMIPVLILRGRSV